MAALTSLAIGTTLFALGMFAGKQLKPVLSDSTGHLTGALGAGSFVLLLVIGLTLLRGGHDIAWMFLTVAPAAGSCTLALLDDSVERRLHQIDKQVRRITILRARPAERRLVRAIDRAARWWTKARRRRAAR